MAIPEKHFYHGAALSLIAARGEFTGLTRLPDYGSSAYAVNHDVGIYVKHTENDYTPWQFNFSPRHQKEVRDLFGRYHEKTFIVLVCGRIGVCLLTYGEYASAIDENFRDQEVLFVERPGGGGFRVRGAAGQLPRVIALNRFPESLFS
ncbi:MAG: hypothetical protein JRJ29_15015 [Deltaproteobacteria bacterium]|nr:hypothetical protein [Deltaproteobacteria bacterium]